MGLQIDWYNHIIKITSPTTDLDAQTLHDFIEDEMSRPVGLQHTNIISPEGKIQDPVNPTVYSQIIIILNSLWQIQFWGGSGYTRIFGGKIVGGVGDEPIKATGTAGDITVLESPVDGLTVATSAGLLSADDINDLSDGVWEKLDQPPVGAAAAANLSTAQDTMIVGAVDETAFAPTTAEFEASDITDAVDDVYKGAVVIFTAGSLKRLRTDITAYTVTGGRGHFTVTAMPQAPASGDTFVVV